jgi:hypothetical protein
LPHAQVVASPIQNLESIRDAAVDQGDSVKQQINGTLGSVRSSLANVRDAVSGNLAAASDKYEPLATRVDLYRYAGSLGLYGVSILFVLLLAACAAGNYHFGSNFSTFWLLLITALYFLLALIIAALVALLHLGCGEVEAVVLDFMPASYQPLLRCAAARPHISCHCCAAQEPGPGGHTFIAAR